MAFQRIQRFLRTYLWIATNHLRGRKFELLVIVALSAVNAVTQAGIIGFIALSADLLQKERATSLPVIGTLSESPLVFLLLLGVCLLGLQCCAALSSYGAAKWTRRVARACHQSCSVRVLRLATTCRELPSDDPAGTSSMIRRLLTRDSNRVGKSVKSLISLFGFALQWAAATAVLLKINAVLTVSLFSFFIFAVPLLYRLSSRVQADAKAFFERATSEMNCSVGQLVGLIGGQNIFRQSFHAERMEAAYLADESVVEYLDLNDRNRLASMRMQSASNLFNSALLSVAFVGGGYLASTNIMSWGMVIAYLVGLRQCMNSMSAGAGTLAMLNRHYSAVVRYYTFCKENTAYEARTSHRFDMKSNGVPDAIALNINPQLPGSAPTASMQKGRPVGYLLDSSIDRFSLSMATAPLAEAGDVGRGYWRREACYDSRGWHLPASRLRDAVVGEDGNPDRVQRFLDVLERLGLRGQFDALTDGMDTPIDQETWENLDPRLKAGMKLALLALDQRSLVFLEAAVLDDLEKDEIPEFLRVLEEKHLVLLMAINQRKEMPTDVIMVAHQGEIVGLGDEQWVNTVTSTVKSMHSKSTSVADDDEAALWELDE